MKIQKITFSEICRLLADRDGDAKKCAAEIFGFALALPDLICPELAAVIESFSTFPVKEALNAKNAILKMFKKTENYYSSYENAQIAQVLMVFSAYFDTIARFLPDEKWRIHLSHGERVTLSEQAVADYLARANSNLMQRIPGQFQDLQDFDLSLPGSFEQKETLDKRLLKFYRLLNEHFLGFYRNLNEYCDLPSAQLDFVHAMINAAPQKALEAYYQQQTALAKEYPEYFIYHTIDWQRKTRETIDIGFQTVSAQIKGYVEQGRETRAKQAMQVYEKRHQRLLRQSILKSQSDTNVDSDGVTFPLNKDIFIPQSFKALRYGNTPLEPDTTWKGLPEQQGIGAFIGHTLRHWDTGDKPMVILGLPGAGKTLLCDMLAAQILRQEYHVIIIRLRDADPEASIADQITSQIHQDLGSDCSWFDIVGGNLEKPIALIFDGYDELLQASGKTYADYISKIHRFQQEQQEDYDITIRCIITSRTTLIDKSQIPFGSPILRLLDFDEYRIDQWSKIWNKHNRSYFQDHSLAEFSIGSGSKVYDLAKQPLLLMLLARFDANGNALRQHKDLTRAQLYNSLIRDFIRREQEKDPQFRHKAPKDQQAILDQVFSRFGIVAMGMYNRSTTSINSTQLSRDLSYFTGEESTEQDGDMLFGSFFFIHTSKAKDQQKNLYAYEFLHNTFGEFLAADYMARQLFRDEKCPDGQYVCLSYATLFTRPVVAEMFRELVAESGLYDKDAVTHILDDRLSDTLHGILNGEILTKLMGVSTHRADHLDKLEPIRHLAIYSANLLILRAALGDYRILLEDYEKVDIWQRLLNIWKYAFSQEDLTRLAGLIRTAKAPGQYTVAYTTRGRSFLKEEKLSQLYLTATHLQDSLMTALAGALDGVGICASLGSGFDLEKLKELQADTAEGFIYDLLFSGEYTQIHTKSHTNNYYFLETTDIIPAAEAHGLNITSKYLWNRAISHFSDTTSQDIAASLMEDLFTACVKEKNQDYLYACYCIMLRLIENAGIRVLSPEDSRRLSRMLLDGLSILPSPCDDSVSQEIHLKLMGYVDLNDAISIQDIFSFVYCNLRKIEDTSEHSSISPVMIRFIRQLFPFFHRLLEVAIAEQSHIPTCLTKIFQKLLKDESEIEDRYPLHREILLFAGHMLSTEQYARLGSSIQSTYEWNHLDHHTTFTQEPDPDFTATVICYLHIMVKNDLVPTLEMLNPTMKGVSIGDLYRVYPDSLSMLINLMGYDPNYPKICFEKMAEFIAEQGEILPVSICKSLCALAKKTSHGAPLLAALNALLS